MKHFIRVLGALLLAGMVGLSSIIVMAAEDQSQTLKVEEEHSQTINMNKTGSVTISYTDAEGMDPVNGAEFTFYRIGEVNQSMIAGSPENSEERSASGTNTNSAIIASAFTSLIDGVDVNPNMNPLEIADIVQEVYESKDVERGQIYSATTDTNGNAVIKGMKIGAYVVVETKAAAGYFESIPCVVTIPQMLYQNDGLTQYWSYNVALFPKPLPAGNLKIQKRLSGNGAEKGREFHFKVTFDTSSAKSTAKEYSQNIAEGIIPKGYHTADTESSSTDGRESKNESDMASVSTVAENTSSSNYGRTYDRASDTYTYEKSNGEKGTMKSGDSLTLKGGEMLTIQNIPAGTFYTVQEQEANLDGYRTSVKNEKNTISHRTLQTVTFINKKIMKSTAASHNMTTRRGTQGESSSNRSAALRNRPKTGDSTTWFAAGGAAVSVLLLIAVIKNQKKEQEEKDG